MSKYNDLYHMLEPEDFEELDEIIDTSRREIDDQIDRDVEYQETINKRFNYKQ